ncbi:psbP domain-containing protein 3, chloroplastic [Physcomitrium patens]|uniref:PsbP C-terminal domain-containing protein n=1 Tax=Physcomitrium patens TaxID=3218 RepID=A9RK31_PHYPA|nr:psbP domain-containing protein 3, chloroplastic-like [Physcomitrium patens]PNR55338.1 hypothetical protein PHYPA_006235 [Physcomitrium patens]|eukprot:XP_024372678.1 psbP domain-containing protein 3, chloroplastic-like [Physcomitrella patens]
MDAVVGRTSCPLSLSSSYQWIAGSPSASRATVVVRGTSRRDGKHKAVRCEQVPECSTSNCQTMQRREVIGQALLAMSMSFAPPARSATDTDAATEFTTYEDAADKFTLLVPQAWNRGEGKTSGQRKVTAFYPADGGLTNVNIVITGLGADFTSLGSFGTADNFAENLVNSLDRSWQKPPGQKARLVDCKSRADKYYVEYTIQRLGEQQRHLVSVVGIGNNGWVNRLYTVTGQYFEEDSAKYKQDINKIISSFKIL